jgi:hypothetical protein
VLKSVAFWVITWRLVVKVNNYHTTPCNNPEDHRFYQHRGGSLKSRPNCVDFIVIQLVKYPEHTIMHLGNRLTLIVVVLYRVERN